MTPVESVLVGNTFLHSVMLSAASAALGTLGVLLAKGATWVSTRIKNEQLRTTWTLASGYAEQVVQAAGSTTIADLKASDSWDAAAAARVKSDASRTLKNMLIAQSNAGAIALPATSAAHTLEDVANTLVGSELHKLENQASAAIDKAVPAAAPVVNLVQQGLGQLAEAHVGQLEDAITKGIAQHLPMALGGASTAKASSGDAPANPTPAVPAP